MYSYSGRRSRIVLGILIVLSIAILTAHFKEGDKGLFHKLQRASLNLIAPIQAGVNTIIKPFYHSSRALSELLSLRSENRKLKKEVVRLQKEVVNLTELEKENKRLRKLLRFAEKVPFRMVPAQVIGKSTSDWQATIILDKGWSEGIKENMPVVVAEGLVGQVVSVAAHASQVQLLIDQKSGVGIQIQETGETGIAQGELGGGLKLFYIDKNSKAKKGDKVITSGLGGVFPKGIFVGVIVSVKDHEYALHKDIKVKPAVDFARLEEVLIITNPPPKPPFLGEGE